MRPCSSAPAALPAQRPRPAASAAPSLRQCIHSLPPSARELIRVLGGVEPVLALVSALGGVTVRVPSRRGESRTANHLLRETLGAAAFRTLVEHYGGTEIYIPRCAHALSRVRNATIIKKFSAGAARGESSGAAVRRLALEYDLSDRRVWEILKTSQ